MKLEEAIHQQKFQHEWQKVIINIMYTNNFVVSKIKKVLKEYGITLQQYNVLRILRGQHPTVAGRRRQPLGQAAAAIDRLGASEIESLPTTLDDAVLAYLSRSRNDHSFLQPSDV